MQGTMQYNCTDIHSPQIIQLPSMPSYPRALFECRFVLRLNHRLSIKYLPKYALFKFLKVTYGFSNAHERRFLMTGKKNEEIAVFRFGIIHEFVGGARLSRDERRQLLREKCDRK